MTTDCTYGFGTEVSVGFDTAVARTEQLLESCGFHVSSRINLRDIIKQELSDGTGQYVIIGACNPEFAKTLFNADSNIGLLMPCNVIVYELPTGGCRIMIKDPVRIMDMLSNPVAIEAAAGVREQMEQVVEGLVGL
jgi:uncharacterized protein (DUF302 family)